MKDTNAHMKILCLVLLGESYSVYFFNIIALQRGDLSYKLEFH